MKALLHVDVNGNKQTVSFAGTAREFRYGLHRCLLQARCSSQEAFMRASVIPIVMLFTFFPPPALSFNDDEFCFAVTDIARRMNARKGKWLDRSTRYDGVLVDCKAKTLEVKRFLNAEPDSVRAGWKTRKSRAWDRDFCSDQLWRKAIDAGWTIISTVTFRSEDRLSFMAECEEVVAE